MRHIHAEVTYRWSYPLRPECYGAGNLDDEEILQTDRRLMMDEGPGDYIGDDAKVEIKLEIKEEE